MPKFVRDYTGLTAGFLRAIRPLRSDGKRMIWEVLCQGCSRTIEMQGRNLQKLSKQGVHASCGCQRSKTVASKKLKHAMSKHPAYAVWRSMRDRCRLSSHQAWRNYGARGIRVCEKWNDSFEAFWSDMGSSYSAGLQLDRIDNSRNYEPSNCRWVPAEVNSNNKRTNVTIQTNQGLMTVSQAARLAGVGRSTLAYRIKNGVPLERLFDTPDSRNRFLT